MQNNGKFEKILGCTCSKKFILIERLPRLEVVFPIFFHIPGRYRHLMGKQLTKSKQNLRKPSNSRPRSDKPRSKGFKSKASKASAYDVYEYTPEKVRRGGINLDLDKEELAGLHSDDEEDAPKARLMGDEQIDSEDDEEIDSDAAFEEDDEDEYAGTFMSKVTFI